ncbi:GerW family sporulation protein [Clostridium sp.]|uniref:GerW family sporulation protein n=1 Tax=Clostridium sp. TaxID=1506 RepID=UPI003991F23C
MENKHPIENLMKSTLENLRTMIDVNTVIGETIETKDGTYIIPISKVCFGFASGGTDFPKTKETLNSEGKFPFGGGSGSGVSVKPIAFLILKDNNIRLLSVTQSNNPYDKLIDTVPQAMEMLKDFIEKSHKEKAEKNKNNLTNECENID